MLNCDMYNVTARVLYMYVYYIRIRMRERGREGKRGEERITLLIDEPCMYNDRMNEISDD